MRTRLLISSSTVLYVLLTFVHTLLTPSFISHVGVKKKLYQRRHHGDHVTWLQVTDHMQNDYLIFYLNFTMHCWLKTF